MTRGPLTGGLPPYQIEFARFAELFKGYAQVQRVETVQNDYLVDRYHITVEMQMMLPEEVPTSKDEEVRALLFWQAQECISILQINGYKLVGDLSIEISGAGHQTYGDGELMVYVGTLVVRLRPPMQGGKRP